MFSHRSAAIKPNWIAAFFLLSVQAAAASPDDPASWPRWLEPSPPLFAFSSHAMASVAEGSAESALAAAGGSDATESLLSWTEHALRLIQKYQQNPQRAVRTLAVLHAAMHDALASAAGDPEGAAASLAAAHRAAGMTLAYLYPYEPASWIEGKGVALAHAWSQRQGVDPEPLRRGLAAGERAAHGAIHRALTDGADRRPAAPRVVAAGPGRWRATPPLNIHTPQEVLAGEWRPWVRGSNELQPPPPPEYGSTRFRAEVDEVYQVWKALTPGQKRIAEDWNLQQGSVTPPGVWNQRAIELIRSGKLDAATAVRLLALLNIAMHDTAIACWRSKYHWWLVRPVTVIREQTDPHFLPHLITPPHPAYVSGHASVSGAAEAVLVAFFPARQPRLRALAEEAALSRLYGGIHYRSDIEEGLRLGRKVGEWVLTRARARGPAESARSGQ